MTGAASGIGRAIAESLTQRGWTVAWLDCDQQQLAPAASGGRLFAIDVADGEQWRRVAADLKAEWPRIDLLVNSAGVFLGGELRDTDPSDSLRVVDVNLSGILQGVHAVLPWLIESGAQRPHGLEPRPGVINVASVFASLAPPGAAVYSATKAAVVGLSSALHDELAPHGLNVTVVAPGVVKTPLFARSVFATPAYQAAANRYLAQAELQPQQVAQATLRAAAQGKRLAIIGPRARRMWLLRRLFPNWMARQIAARASRDLAAAHLELERSHAPENPA